MEEFRNEQSSVRVWPIDFSREAGRPASSCNPKCSTYGDKASTCTSQKWLRPASCQPRSTALSWTRRHVVRVGRWTILTVGRKANAFFAEHRKSVRNSDVEVSRTPGLKFWMLLEGESKARSVRSITSAATSASTKLGGTHSRIPYRSRTWFGARRAKHEVAFAESRKSSRPRTEEGTARSPYPTGGPQSLPGGMALKSHLCVHSKWERAMQEKLKRCSTFSRGEEVQTFFPFRCLRSPSMVCARGKPVSPEVTHDAALDVCFRSHQVVVIAWNSLFRAGALV